MGVEYFTNEGKFYTGNMMLEKYSVKYNKSWNSVWNVFEPQLSDAINQSNFPSPILRKINYL